MNAEDVNPTPNDDQPPNEDQLLMQLVTALEAANSKIGSAHEIAEKQMILHDELMNMLKRAFTDGFQFGVKRGYEDGYTNGYVEGISGKNLQ
jgi:flagellar biosynthesis/type III secretory pathway protein FliH